MKRFLVLFAIVVFISISFINCGEDEVTEPETKNNPTVNITNPQDSAPFTEGETISFAGTGVDYESNTLPDSMLIWTSDQDDTIGTGTAFDRNDLSVNTHVITLTGTDGDGKTDSDNITIDVNSGSSSGYNELISVPAGSYLMGWDDFISGHEDPAHTVSLNAFRIGKYEVTYELWIEVKTYADAHEYIINDGVWGDGSNSIPYEPVTDIHWKDCVAWCNAYSEKEGLTPVYSNSSGTGLYKDASALFAEGNIGSDCVNWSADGYRLPTEAEWECAARYIDGTTVSRGDKHSGYNLYTEIDSCAWFRDNSISSTERVGLLKANSLGAYDMSGNVYEWCWDWYKADYYGESPINNPHGPESGVSRINRGGSWGMDSASIYAYVAHRGGGNPWDRHLGGGFRVCRSGSGQ